MPWGYLEYRGDVQYHGGYTMSTVGEYLEYRGGCIMIHVADIMNTVGVFSTLGDIIFCYLSTSKVINTPMVLMIFPTCIMISPHRPQTPKKYVPHRTEHSPQYSRYPPRYL